MDIKYKIEFLTIAAHDLADIENHLSQFYESTVGKFLENLHRKLNLLKKTPRIYALWPDNPAYRKFAVGNYLIFYQVFEETRLVTVCRILDGRRNIEPDDMPDAKM